MSLSKIIMGKELESLFLKNDFQFICPAPVRTDQLQCPHADPLKKTDSARKRLESPLQMLDEGNSQFSFRVPGGASRLAAGIFLFTINV